MQNSIKRCLLLALLLLCCQTISASANATRGLEIYFVDTEGGAATLIVSPAGESTLIDNGNPGERDAERVFQWVLSNDDRYVRNQTSAAPPNLSAPA